jgi:SAM-dependent methyltransferase
VGWNGVKAQEIRYEQLSKLLDNEEKDFSILDYGCGYGYYFDFLKEKIGDSQAFRYYGIDVSREMINRAVSLHENEGALCLFTKGQNIQADYDYIVASGIFNLKQDIETDVWKQYIIDTIEAFNQHSKNGFAFNALTKYSDAEKMRKDLFYSDPLYLFDYCKKNFSRNVALLHDYEIYDFTIIVRK